MVKNSPDNAGDTRDVSSIPGSGGCPREGNGTPLQYSCLRNSMDRRAWQTTVHGVAKRWKWTTAYFMTQLSHPYMTTEKTIALTIQTFVKGDVSAF